ncbi:unnamed protein product, partial [Polarella glacialis]
AVATLQEAVSRSSLPTSSPSIAGAAFVYLGLALDGDRGEGPQAASLVLKGLAKHRNLECVWRSIEAAHQPSPAVIQKLRGICDLDLTTQQARRLLSLLARASGRHLGGGGGGGGSAASSQPGSRSGSARGSRSGSVAPPNRSQWASPCGEAGYEGMRSPDQRRSLSPSPWGSQVLS